jgi:hypothetical protein
MQTRRHIARKRAFLSRDDAKRCDAIVFAAAEIPAVAFPLRTMKAKAGRQSTKTETVRHKFRIASGRGGKLRVQFLYNAEVMIWSETYSSPRAA